MALKKTPVVTKPVATAPAAEPQAASPAPAPAAAPAPAPAAAPVAAAPVAAPVAAPAAEAPASTGNALAIPAQGTALAPVGSGGLADQVHAVTNDDGFGALDSAVGFGSFPIITLKDDFQIGDEKVGDGESFDCVMLTAREKWIIKEADKNETDFLMYSYDGQRTLSGTLVDDELRIWASKGVEKTERKKYVEVQAQIQGGSLDGQFVLLSIAPASVNRLGGYRVSVAAQHKKKLNQVVTKCKKGPKVKVSSAISFYPWEFECTAILDESV